METNTTNDWFKPLREFAIPISIVAAAVIVAGAVFATSTSTGRFTDGAQGNVVRSALEEIVLPKAGVKLPAVWGDLGARLVEVGAIDATALKQMYEGRGAFTVEYNDLLIKRSNDALTITPENDGYLLNLLWALGLANKNPILESGEMTDPAYGGAGNFASTGGWTLAKGDAMEHYSKHALIVLSLEQQALVDRVSRNIYRPCCGNSAHFPDCNHGMAMLGLLELMASQGTSEEEMYKAALAVNSHWFPDTYLTIATYMQEKKGIAPNDVAPTEVIGSEYSSSAGFQEILSQVSVPASGGGSGCGV